MTSPPVREQQHVLCPPAAERYGRATDHLGYRRPRSVGLLRQHVDGSFPRFSRRRRALPRPPAAALSCSFSLFCFFAISAPYRGDADGASGAPHRSHVLRPRGRISPRRASPRPRGVYSCAQQAAPPPTTVRRVATSSDCLPTLKPLRTTFSSSPSSSSPSLLLLHPLSPLSLLLSLLLHPLPLLLVTLLSSALPPSSQDAQRAHVRLALLGLAVPTRG